MEYYSVRDLTNNTKAVWNSLAKNDVVITANGKPSAMLLDISAGNFEEICLAVKRARAAAAFEQIRKDAAKRGYWTEDDIETEIAAARKDKRAKSEGARRDASSD